MINRTNTSHYSIPIMIRLRACGQGAVSFSMSYAPWDVEPNMVRYLLILVIANPVMLMIFKAQHQNNTKRSPTQPNPPSATSSSVPSHPPWK
jgi:hypothetical protein